jgi:fructose-bisphosphate aldolase class I
MNTAALEPIANSIVQKGKGVLAADESLRSTERRFTKYNIPHTPENRQAYRDLMFTAPGIEQFIDGIILYDETIHQTTLEGIPFAEYINSRGIIPGIKVDTGFVDMAGFPGEKITEGIDGLDKRLKEYYQLGARFTKWRAVITIGEGLPTEACLRSNAYQLARFAIISQENGMVPFVEPDVLMDGTHDIRRCEEVTSRMLELTFFALKNHRVHLEGTILKPNMVLPGKDCPDQASLDAVAEATARTLRRNVPAAIPGVVFLSGGQGAKPSTERLNAIVNQGPFPWQVSFSYLRALADPACEVWLGQTENKEKAQKVFYHRASLVAAAREGKYTEAMEVNV